MSCSSGNFTDEAGKSSQNFQVCVRIRPLNSKEEQQTTKRFHSIIQTQDNMLFVYDPTENSIKDIISNSQNGSTIQSNSTFGYSTNSSNNTSICLLQPSRRPEKEFMFDYVFDERTSTEQVFNNSILPSIDHILSGYNSTVFAYGMTGAGKTHTIFGNLQNAGQSSSDGIALMTLNALQAKASNSTNQIVFKFSYLEIYNENIRDLMVESSENLMVVEDSQKGVFVPDLTEFPISHPDDIRKFIIQGNTRRIMAATAANQFSSRSHAIIQILCEQKNHGQNQNILSKLCIVDLAGSERGAVTENRGVRLQEGANINRSLLALGNCINLLSDNAKKGSFVPYRDSKLTRLLKESLGGNTRSIMIACISPSSLCYEETVNTLKYAVRARCIKKNVKKNTSEMAQHVSEYKMIIEGLRSEIVTLHEQLKAKSNENQLLKIKQNISQLHAENQAIDQEDKGIQNVEEIGQLLFENLEEHWEISTTIEEIINLNQISENYIIEKEERLKLGDIQELSAEEAYQCQDEIVKRREVIQSNQEILTEMNAKLEKNIELKKQLHMKIKNIGSMGVNISQNITLAKVSEQLGLDVKENNYAQSSIKDNQILKMQMKMQILEEELKNKDKLLQQKQAIIQNLTGNETLNGVQNSTIATKLVSTATPISYNSANYYQHGNSNKVCQPISNKNYSQSSKSQQSQLSTNYYCPSEQELLTNKNQFYLKLPKETVSERRVSNSSTGSHASQVSSIFSMNQLGFNDSLGVTAGRSGLKRQSSSSYYSNSNNCSQNEDINYSSKKNKNTGVKHNFSQHQTSNVEPVTMSMYNNNKQSSSKNSNIDNCTFNLSSRQAISYQSPASLQAERPTSNSSSSKITSSQFKNGQCSKKTITGINGIRLFENPSNLNNGSGNTMVISMQELKSQAQKLKDADSTIVRKEDIGEKDKTGETDKQEYQENNCLLMDDQKLENNESEVIINKLNSVVVVNIVGETINENEEKQNKIDNLDFDCDNDESAQLNEITKSNENEHKIEVDMNNLINEKIQVNQQQQQQQYLQVNFEEQLRGKSLRNSNQQEYEINSYASARKRVRELKERLSRLCDNPSNSNPQTPQNHPSIQCEDTISFQDLQSLNHLQSLRNNSSNNIKNTSNHQLYLLPFSKPANQKNQNNENLQPQTTQDSVLRQQQFNNTASNFNSNKKTIQQGTRSSHFDNYSGNLNTNSASYAQQQQLRMQKRGGQGDMSSTNKNNTINTQNYLKSINNNLNHLTDFSSQIMSNKNINSNSNASNSSNKTKLPRGMLSQINQNYSETHNYSKKQSSMGLSSNQSNNYKESKIFNNPSIFLSPNHQSSFNTIGGQLTSNNRNKSPKTENNKNNNNNNDQELKIKISTKQQNQENNENIINI